MNGAIFYSSKYGSTAQYAHWISEATGLPVFDIIDANADPEKYDLLILGSSVIYYKLSIRKWVAANLADIENKPVLLFTVSGARDGPKLDRWIADCLPQHLISRMKHVSLGGRQNPEELDRWDWIMLRISALFNKDPKVRKEEFEGFDFMDKTGIKPVVNFIQQFQSTKSTLKERATVFNPF